MWSQSAHCDPSSAPMMTTSCLHLAAGRKSMIMLATSTLAIIFLWQSSLLVKQIFWPLSPYIDLVCSAVFMPVNWITLGGNNTTCCNHRITERLGLDRTFGFIWSNLCSSRDTKSSVPCIMSKVALEIFEEEIPQPLWATYVSALSPTQHRSASWCRRM